MQGYNSGGWMPPDPNAANQKQALRRDANFVGIIAFSTTLLLQLMFFMVFFILSLLGVSQPGTDIYYGLGSIGFLITYSIIYCIGIGLPAPFTALITDRRIRPFDRFDETDEQIRPNALQIILILFAGLSICVLSNFAASYIMMILNELGLQPPDMPSYLDKSVLSLILNIIVFALFPAILEEMVYRGYILRILKAHGDTFAMVISSLLFALMHANIMQIPFAFIIGLTCAFIALKTGYVWIAVMLHFLNNFMSLLLQYAGLFSANEEQSQRMIMIVFSIVGILGLVSILILYATANKAVRRIEDKEQTLTAAQKTGVLLLSPGIIISILLSLFFTIITTR